MLYNNELIKKLRIAAISLSSLFALYTLLVFNDGLINNTQLLIILSSLAASLLGIAFLAKPNKYSFSFYAISMIVVLVTLLFRYRGNVIIDVTLLLVTIPLLVLFLTQIKKTEKNHFA